METTLCVEVAKFLLSTGMSFTTDTSEECEFDFFLFLRFVAVYWLPRRAQAFESTRNRYCNEESAGECLFTSPMAQSQVKRARKQVLSCKTRRLRFLLRDDTFTGNFLLVVKVKLLFVYYLRTCQTIFFKVAFSS